MNTFYKNYLYVFLISTLIIFVLVISTNRVVDPYSYFYEPPKKEFNFLKPYIPTTRAKALAILKIRPKTIILGSSRTEQGMDPNHVLWDDINTPEKENFTDILERSLSIADALIVELFDTSDSDKWTWGKLHTITYPTNFSKTFNTF